MRCSGCGQLLAEGATTCPACGRTVPPLSRDASIEGAVRDAAREVKGLTKAAVREAKPIASAALRFTKGAIREAGRAAKDAARELEGKPRDAPAPPPPGAVSDTPPRRKPSDPGTGSP